MPESAESERSRMILAAELNEAGVPESYDGPVWDTDQMTQEFIVHGFAAPFIVVTRKSDGVKGTLTFTHRPRWYFDFQPTT